MTWPGLVKVHNTTGCRVLARFRAYGDAGLRDGRSDNGDDKLPVFFARIGHIARGVSVLPALGTSACARSR